MKKENTTNENFSKGIEKITDAAAGIAKDKIKDTVMNSEIANEAKEKAKTGLWTLIKGIIGL